LLINNVEISRIAAQTRKVLDLTDEEYKRFIGALFETTELENLSDFAQQILDLTRQALENETENLPT